MVVKKPSLSAGMGCEPVVGVILFVGKVALDDDRVCGPQTDSDG